MNYVDYRFGLDVKEIGSQVFFSVKEGDTNRRLFISLSDGHEPYAIGENCVAVFTGTKADGNVIFNNAVIDGNEIIYEFTEQTVAAVGNMACEVRLYGDERLLCSPGFTIAVLPDKVGGKVESLTEVNTLTALINEAAELTRNFAEESEELLTDVDRRAEALVDEVRTEVESGAFVPELEIGTVTTLPPGANATAGIRGTGKKPILDLGIPQGPVGTADGLVFDSALSKESINPVQNKVITEEFEKVRQEQSEYEQATDEAFDSVNESLAEKVDKISGKGLSTNDFTAEEKEKLAGIEAEANKFVLGDGAVTGEKIAQGAICVGAASFTLSSSGWALNDKGVYEQEKTTTLGVSPEKHIGFLGLTRGLLHYPGDGNSSWGWSQSLIAADREKIACLYSASLIATNTIKFVATEIPNGSLYVTILFFRR